MAKQATKDTDKILSITVGDNFTQEDMKRHAADLEAKISEVGQIRLLLIMEKFPKIEPAAFWKDLKFSSEHYSDIERMALVGQSEWQNWYAKLVDMWPNVEVKHFEMDQMEAAYNWLGED